MPLASRREGSAYTSRASARETGAHVNLRLPLLACSSTVNVAARVERLTRVHGVDILVTEAVRTTLDGRFRPRAMTPVEVKGISAALPTFAVEGFDDPRA